MQRSLPLLLFLIYINFPVFGEPVLVVPFFSQSASANVDWIGESIAHTIQEALATRGIFVLDRAERETVYRRLSIRPNATLTRASIIKVAEALDASEVVAGEFELVSQAGKPAGVRISAQTIDVRRLRRRGQFTEAGPLADLAALQGRLAWQVLRDLAPDVTPELEPFLRERPAVRLDAIENYTRGLLAVSPEQKHRLFTQAARLDERFSEPSYELGRLYWDKKDYARAAAWLARVGPEAPRHLEATFLLGLCRFHTGDFAGAQRAFQTVASAVPLNEVFNNLGAAQSRLNRPEALENFRKALEGDTADPDYHFNVGYALWKQGRFQQAAASFRAVLERNPEDAQATFLLGRCLRRSGAGADPPLERVKVNYEERAYRQLKAALESLKRR